MIAAAHKCSLPHPQKQAALPSSLPPFRPASASVQSFCWHCVPSFSFLFASSNQIGFAFKLSKAFYLALLLVGASFSPFLVNRLGSFLACPIPCKWAWVVCCIDLWTKLWFSISISLKETPTTSAHENRILSCFASIPVQGICASCRLAAVNCKFLIVCVFLCTFIAEIGRAVKWSACRSTIIENAADSTANAAYAYYACQPSGCQEGRGDNRG